MFEGRAGDAARHRSRHLSVRHLVQRVGRRRLHRPRRAAARDRRRARRGQGLHDARRRRAAADRAVGRRWRTGCARSGQEYGASTGRPRRCGWYDAVVVRYSARINGLDALALTKLDVLDGLPEVHDLHRLQDGSGTITEFPADLRVLAGAEPIYETMPGWSTPTKGVTRFEQLPAEAQRYVAAARGGERRRLRDHLDRLRSQRDDRARRGLGGRRRGSETLSTVSDRASPALHALLA